MVRQILNPMTVSAFVDEMTKIAVGPEKALKVLKNGPFSTNIGKPSSIKMTMPTLRSAPPPPVGRVTTMGGSSIAAQTPGVNIRPPTTKSPKMPLQQPIQSSVAPASPSYVSPQVNVQAAPTIQGRPQVTQAAPQATGGGAGSVAAPGSPGGMGSMGGRR